MSYRKLKGRGYRAFVHAYSPGMSQFGDWVTTYKAALAQIEAVKSLVPPAVRSPHCGVEVREAI